MKCEHPSLYAALLVGVLVNVLLRSQTAYWCRAGAAAALVCAPVLAAVGALFAVSWRQGATPLLRLLFALLLAGTSVLELLRLWNLTQRLYPGAVTQLALCLLVLLPILYLRRVSAISQTAYVVLCLLCIATAGMLLSVFPRLHITNLQNAALIWPDFADAARDQLTLYPEYLLPALWPEPQKRGRHTLLWLAGVALGGHAPAGRPAPRRRPLRGTLGLYADGMASIDFVGHGRYDQAGALLLRHDAPAGR